MRVLFFLLASFCLLCASAQTRVRLDENTVVKDTGGNVLPYGIWRPLMGKVDYSLRPANHNDPQAGFILIRLSEQESQARLLKMGRPRESDYFTTGKTINLFNEKDINGNKLQLKDMKGKVVVLNFWFINCQPCRTEIPELNKLVDSFAGNKNVVFAAVALDQAYDLENFLKVLPFKYHVVDNGRFLAEKYGIRSYPTHVVVDTEGKVYFHTTGLAPNTVFWIKKSIEEILAKVNP